MLRADMAGDYVRASVRLPIAKLPCRRGGRGAEQRQERVGALSLPDAVERSPKKPRLTRETSSNPNAPGLASTDPFLASSVSVTEDVEMADEVPPAPNEAEANARERQRKFVPKPVEPEPPRPARPPRHTTGWQAQLA